MTSRVCADRVVAAHERPPARAPQPAQAEPSSPADDVIAANKLGFGQSVWRQERAELDGGEQDEGVAVYVLALLHTDEANVWGEGGGGIAANLNVF